jgi:hypothetical protein
MPASTAARPSDPRLEAASASATPLPRGPILDWSSFQIVNVPSVSSVENLAHTAFTTSGRAAIYQALLQLRLPPSSTVLVPSYHCPTMVAPVVLANLNVSFFGLRADGLPNLESIDAVTASKSTAMIVSHYFGLARSLAEVRRWCDERAIALIEDCAHCYFGQAGERPVGAWGDFATASLSKFFPVSEGGLLASAHRPIPGLQLSRAGLRAQAKGWVDVLELATQYKRLAGLNSTLAFLFRLKNSHRRPEEIVRDSEHATTDEVLLDCDMARVAQAPLWASTTLKTVLPHGRIIAKRRQNFTLFARHFERVPGARPLFHVDTASFPPIVPYVFPLWVDDADRVYLALRAQKMPVFRWDRTWPGAPRLAGDAGAPWRRHVLQLLCHQDLNPADIARTALAIRRLLSAPDPSDEIVAP